MVNYCAVYGCGRNCKTSKHLNYYSLPKDKLRLEVWLKAIGREDILKGGRGLNYRVCSRHFSRTSIKNKHLCADAVPTLNLPGSWDEGSEDSDSNTNNVHLDVVCNSCEHPILGFRYKCVTCDDYDLCNKCELNEEHNDHYMLRIPKPGKSKVTEDLAEKWKKFLVQELLIPSKTADASSDDDEPITKYVKHYDSGIDLSEDTKERIRQEVTRVLSLKVDKEPKVPVKRKGVSKKKKDNKKIKGEKVELNKYERENDDTETLMLGNSRPLEVVFADVDNLTGNHIVEVKEEIQTTFTPLEEPPQHKVNDTLSDFMINYFGDIRASGSDANPP